MRLDLRNLVLPLLGIATLAAPAYGSPQRPPAQPKAVSAGRPVRLAAPESAQASRPRLLPEWHADRDRLARRDSQSIFDLYVETPADEPVEAGFDIHHAGLVLLSLGAGLAGIWLMVISQRVRRTIPRNNAADADAAVTPVNRLEALLRNELPVFQEAVLLPMAARVYGRPVPLVRYRVDVAHAPGEPHLPVIVPGMTPSVPTQAAQRSGPLEMRVEAPHFRQPVAAPRREAAMVRGELT